MRTPQSPAILYGVSVEPGGWAVFDGSDDASAAGPRATSGDGPDSAESPITAPTPVPGRRRSRTKTGLVLRLAAPIGLALLGFGGVFYDVARSVGGVTAAAVLPITSLPVSVAVTGVLIPILSFVLLQRFTAADGRQLLLGGVPARDEGSGRDAPEPAPWPHHSPLALMTGPLSRRPPATHQFRVGDRA